MEGVRLVESMCARRAVLSGAVDGLGVTVVSLRACGGLHFKARRDNAVWLEYAGFCSTTSMVLNWVRFVDGIHFFARERREEVRLLGY
jgi:hypothetical protein